jgi:hypothetical protein
VIRGVAVFYEPNAGFRGTDSFRYRRINAQQGRRPLQQRGRL